MNRVILVAALLAIFGPSALAGSSAYRVAAEDTIGVIVARHAEFSGDYVVPSDGTITSPGAGRVTVAGKTMNEIASELTKLLSDRLNSPEVTVTLRAARMQRVYVLGTVQKAGLYDLKPGWRVTEALAAAGGVGSGVEAADCSVSVLRAASSKRDIVRLADVLKGDPQANTAVDTGDVITVEADETIPVYVTGRVKSPGIYRLRIDGSGVVEALTLAGGTLDDASLSKITVQHADGKSNTLDLADAIVSGKPTPKLALRPSDLITVPQETSRIAVLGNVNQPGFYPVKDNDRVTLMDALGLARGVDARYGKTSEIAVIRTVDGKQQRMAYDLGKFAKSGDASQNPVVKPGDVIFVPKTSRVNWDSIIGSVPLLGLLLH